MIWYIFNKHGMCVATMSGKRHSPDKEDLDSRQEFAVLSDVDLGEPATLMYMDGQIKKMVPIPKEE